MKIALGADHGGYELKETVKKFLSEKGYEVEDVGTYGSESVDYPDYAQKAVEAILEKRADAGILICGSGIGISIAANRFKGIRAALCSEPYSAKLSRQHNNANVLCMGGRLVGDNMAIEIVETWLNTEFEGGRHQRRIDKLDN